MLTGRAFNGLLFLTAWFGASHPDTPLAELQQQIKTLVEGQKAVYGVAFKNLETGETLFHNGDDVMHAASTMKTPVMMRLFQMVDQGELTLHQPIPVENRFVSIVDGSQYTITVDSEEALYRKIDSSVTLESLIEAMITKSSNLATNILIQLAGAEQTTEFMKQLGALDIQVLRGVEDLKAFEKGLNNESSAAAMLAVMVACVSSSVFSDSSKGKMTEILRRQHFNDIIPAGLPQGSGALVAHKTGSISRVQHDAAIVQLPDGVRYGLVIFARDFGDERALVKETGRKISRLVYNHVTRAGRAE